MSDMPETSPCALRHNGQHIQDLGRLATLGPVAADVRVVVMKVFLN